MRAEGTGATLDGPRTVPEVTQMNVATPRAEPDARLLEWLSSHGIEFEVHRHDPAFTALQTARAEGVEPRTFAKVVVVAAGDDRTVMIVLDATDHLDVAKARLVFDTNHVRLLAEPELLALAPGCDVGAMPAVGALYGLPTYADHAVHEEPEISFNAGSHQVAARVDRARWERACGVVYADLAEATDSGPAWAR
jgi:Ala-tRNA(Pro) deacylase